jgi:hypothetical protein
MPVYMKEYRINHPEYYEKEKAIYKPKKENIESKVQQLIHKFKDEDIKDEDNENDNDKGFSYELFVPMYKSKY